MVEIKIQCPTCKHQMTVQVQPDETIFITCPQCGTHGKYTYGTRKQQDISEKKDIVVVDHLKKTYGKDIVAVNDISFRVHQGEIFGFLGPNGAGKSTTIKILTTLLEKTSGNATIGGFDIDQQQAQVRRIIGYSSQDVGVDNDLTARENLLLQCRFHHLPKAEAEKKVDELLKTVKLIEAANRRLKTFSGGMRKRLDLASSLVSDPQILFLDEPTTGLDPQSRQDIWDYVVQLNRKGMTIFLTTQYMEEADRLSNRLCIIDQGKIVAEGTPADLKAKIGADTITLHFKANDLNTCEKAKQLLAKLPDVEAVGQCGAGLVSENGLTIMTKNGSAMVAKIVRALDMANIAIEQLTLSVPTLDEVFLKLTGKTLNVIERKEAVRPRGRRG
ncbi:MAG TPA: ATP-binding cassette domain-containing protein [Candidatus Thermoplasmatota archaeon]|nr:ATP-binding cassette domain-containing protein [Candidatus Thermoplasmatota archaeon]